MSRQRSHARVVIALALLAALVVACLSGPEIASLPIASFGAPAETRAALTAGQRLSFSYHVEDYEYSGGNAILLDVDLLQGGRSVQRTSCSTFRIKPGAGCGSSAMQSSSSCSVAAPAGGADAIRVTARLASADGSFTAKAMRVGVHSP